MKVRGRPERIDAHAYEVSIQRALRQRLRQQIENWESSGIVAPPEDEVAEAMVAAIPERTESNEIAEAVGPMYSTKGVMRILGVTKQAIDDRRRNGTILAARTADGSWVYPAFQFQDGAVNPTLKPALRALRSIPAWAAALWFVTPNDQLHDLTPVDFVHHGHNVEYVTQSATAFAADLAVGPL